MMLEPDRDQLEIFIEGMLRHCGTDGVVSLRAFYEGDSKKPFRITNVPLKGGLPFLMEAAEDGARRAANDPKPVVFCPPVVTFRRDANGRAREQDLLEAPAFSVELDRHPRAALEGLERLLGAATLVVRSGGTWTDPTTGEVEDKLHAHWRLKEPARGVDIAKLKQLRKLATTLIGGDPTNVPACHPIRWPGSWWRKAEPRLCEIINTDHLDNEIDLDVALVTLEDVTLPPPKGGDGAQPSGGQGALDWDDAFGKIIRGEQFHPVLIPLASSFAARGIPEAAALRALRALLSNTQITDPARIARRDTELGKLKDTVRSGYQKFASPTGTELFDPWQLFIVPPFPFDILPAVAQDYVGRKSTALGADASALAMALLTALSGAIHHRFRLKMMRNSDWWEHLRLWLLLFGRSSYLKSPILEAVMRPIKRYQAELQRDYRVRLREWKAQNKGKKGDEIDEEEPAPPERFIVGDATIEKLGEIMSRSERGLIAEHDELAGFIGRMERYQHGSGKGASTDRAFYLQSWNGGGYPIDRVKSGEIFVPNLSLSIIGGIQPSRMNQLRDLTADGLLQRFSIVLVRAPKEPQDIDCTEVTKAYTALVYELISLRPQRLYLTDSAVGAMTDLQRHLHNLAQVGEALSEAFEGHIGKLKAYAGVLAMILQLITDPKETMRLAVIGRQTVEKVHRLITEFLLPHAREFYSLSEGDSERLRKLASYVLTSGKERLRLADLTNNVWDCRGLTVTEINQRVSPLVAGGWLATIEQGPACRAWEVNRAAIDAQFAAKAQTERENKAALAQLIGARRRA